MLLFGWDLLGHLKPDSACPCVARIRSHCGCCDTCAKPDNWGRHPTLQLRRASSAAPPIGFPPKAACSCHVCTRPLDVPSWCVAPGPWELSAMAQSCHHARTRCHPNHSGHQVLAGGVPADVEQVLPPVPVSWTCAVVWAVAAGMTGNSFRKSWKKVVISSVNVTGG